MLVIPLIILFLVIIFVVHGDDPWGKKEMAIIFLMSFSAIFFTGPGKYSVDNLILR